MGPMFTNKADAAVWLYQQGWRQNDEGQWLKAGRKAVFKESPVGDGVTVVAFVKAARMVRASARAAAHREVAK